LTPGSIDTSNECSQNRQWQTIIFAAEFGSQLGIKSSASKTRRISVSEFPSTTNLARVSEESLEVEQVLLSDRVRDNDAFMSAPGQDVPLDSIEEFSVQTNHFSAEYGRNSGFIAKSKERRRTRMDQLSVA
jgi:hypothetical protein